MFKEYELTAEELRKLKTIKGQEFRTMILAEIIGIEKDLITIMKCLNDIGERMLWMDEKKSGKKK